MSDDDRCTECAGLPPDPDALVAVDDALLCMTCLCALLYGANDRHAWPAT